MSKNGVFMLGYKCPSPYGPYCGLGIWFANSSGCDRDYLPFWQPANQERYSPDYNLSFSEDGIVRDQVNSSIVIWQSFDEPYQLNILLGGSLGLNTITSTTVTLVSYSNWLVAPSMYYTLALDTTRSRGFTILRNGKLIFASTFPRWMDIHEDGHYGLTFNDMHTYIQFTIRFTHLTISAPGGNKQFILKSKHHRSTSQMKYQTPIQVILKSSPNGITDSARLASEVG